jgi:hypothetical protein
MTPPGGAPGPTGRRGRRRSSKGECTSVAILPGPGGKKTRREKEHLIAVLPAVSSLPLSSRLPLRQLPGPCLPLHQLHFAKNRFLKTAVSAPARPPGRTRAAAGNTAAARSLTAAGTSAVPAGLAHVFFLLPGQGRWPGRLPAPAPRLAAEVRTCTRGWQ